MANLTLRVTTVLTEAGPKVRVDFSIATEFLELSAEQADAHITALQAARALMPPVEKGIL